MSTHCNSDPFPVIMEDDLIHTNTHPFCRIDPTCPCHEDPVLIAQVASFVEQGFLTPAEATSLVRGISHDGSEKEDQP